MADGWSQLFQLQQENFFLENLSFWATLIGVPALLITYITNLVAEGHRREVGTYDTLETQYVEFQKQALLYSKLDVADSGLERPQALSDVERVQQRTLYMMLFSLFERAYLMYQPGLFGRLFMARMRKQQWHGWVNYMDRYLQRESCRAAWFGDDAPGPKVSQDFDERFERFIWERVRRQERRA